MDSNTIVGVVSIGVVGAIGFFSNYFLRKQHQVHGLVEAFRILDSTEHRRSRTRVYALNFEYLDTKRVTSFKTSEVEDVRGDFDVMGKLVRSKNIDKNEFLEEYGLLAYRCWKCLQADIKDERDDRHFKSFMKHFQWLANEAYEYWKDKEDLSKTKLYHPDDPSRSVDFQRPPGKQFTILYFLSNRLTVELLTYS